MSKTILFFGNERLATGVSTSTPILKALVLNGYNIAAIIVTPSVSRSSRKTKPLEVEMFAQEHSIPLVKLANLLLARNELANYQAEVAILAAFGRIIPQEIIDLFPYGIINIHPSLLPKHRGPTPIESPILAGENKTGVSLMSLVAAMDAGPLYDQLEMPLNGTESKQQLSDRLAELGAGRLIQLLPAILDGKISPVAQQKNEASYDQKISTDQAILDFSKPAAILEREIRAFYGWPRSKTTLNKDLVIITQAHILKTRTTRAGKLIIDKAELGVQTSDGVLMIDRLIPAGAKEMSIADYLRGHQL